MQYRCLRRHWNKWIKTAGKNMDLDLTGLRSMTMYNVLRVREEGEIVLQERRRVLRWTAARSLSTNQMIMMATRMVSLATILLLF